MSAIQRSILALALTLAAVLGSATPAAAQQGIWVNLDSTRLFGTPAWTLTVINLTEYPLSLLTTSVDPSGNQRPPFNGNTLDGAAAFPLAPFRNVTWKSNTSSISYPGPHWNGTLTFLPGAKDTNGNWQGMDPKWTVTLNFSQYGKPILFATWVYLTADVTNPDGHWLDAAGYDISCSYPDDYNSTYNVMTLSGTDLVVTLYAPEINLDTFGPMPYATLVFRQRWPHTQLTNGYQDSLVMPCLKYRDNNGYW